ncbi:MAG: site-2 protease family protein, partial [Minisyncoccia bacterium]
MSNVILIALEILIFVYSIIIHEISHGYAALRRGDKTALAYGRLTLNPVPHIDPIGSILLPLTLFILTRGQVVFGWAKPVPVNPYNFNNPRKDEAFVSLAGPLSNLILATIFGLVLRFWPMIS